MIAKASTIPHGANAIRYSVNKDRADIVKANLLPDDISPEAMYGRMILVQKMFAEKINIVRNSERAFCLCWDIVILSSKVPHL